MATGQGQEEKEKPMSAKRKVQFTPEQRAEHRRLRELFTDWHPSPEGLIASDKGKQFSIFGEYPYLRPFLAELKQAREAAGMSLADVAARSGIDKAALSRLENGQNPNPTLDTLWRYATALGKRLLLRKVPECPQCESQTRGKPDANPVKSLWRKRVQAHLFANLNENRATVSPAPVASATDPPLSWG